MHMTIKRLLILGGTGAVGRSVVKQALEHDDVLQVIAPTRRPLPPHPKLTNPCLDFSTLPASFADAHADLQAWLSCDAVICALGTTMRQAGSRAAFSAVDKTLVLTLATLAKAGGARIFALNSSLGASPHGSFYLRVKSEVEQAIRELEFDHTTIVRPSLIDTVRENNRPIEHLGLRLFRLTKPLIPRRYRAVTPDAIARALLSGAFATTHKTAIIESENIL